MLGYTEKTMFGFVAAFFSNLWWPSLPPFYLLLLSVFIALGLAKNAKTPVLLGAILGFIFAGIVGHYYLSWQLPEAVFNQNVMIEATVTSIHHEETIDSLRKQNRRLTTDLSTHTTEDDSSQEHVEMKVELSMSKAGKLPLNLRPTIRLSWYQPQFKVQQGDIILVLATLKRPAGLANPDGFNYQKWLASKNIVATGYIQDSPSNRIIEATTTFRQRLVHQILAMKLHNPAEILSLSLGYRKLLSKETWQVIQETGTAHLFAISGLHLGIVFICMFVLCKWSLFLLVMANRLVGIVNGQVNVAFISLIVATAVAGLYAYISGFEVPVVRAIIALSVVSFLSVAKLHWRLPSTLLLLLTIFICLQPLSLLSLSFWFSFGAVAAIWFCLWMLPKNRKSWWAKASAVIKMQLLLGILLVPIVAYSFQYFSYSSPLINLIAVPVVTLLMLPLCALSLVLLIIGFDDWSTWLFRISDQVLGFGLKMLGSIVEHNTAGVQIIALPISSILSLLLACIVLLLPHWPAKKTLAFILLLPFGSQFIAPKSDTWFINVMDVGQGLSVVVQTPNNYLVYDTGAHFRGGFSMAQAVLLPYFKAKKVTQLDHLVLSHSDNDHSGGKNVLIEGLNIEGILDTNAGCNKLQAMDYFDGLEPLLIQVFWPLAPLQNAKNNQSCVVKLTHNKTGISVLLTGDIEAKAERQLVTMHQQKDIDLRADILIAPHHGSKTSSTPAFIDAVSAKHVVFSAQHNHRWGFPHAAVQTRYANTRATLHNTGTQGRIAFSIDDEIKFSAYRTHELNRWYNKP